MIPGVKAWVALIVVALTVLGVPARADVKAPVETPWSKGVSKKQQKAAFELFDKGNKLAEEGKYADALTIYEQALTEWDHPTIRFNAAVCLINIRQPLVAWEFLEKALAYGAEPLGKRLYADAQSYLAVLEGTLTKLTVIGKQPEVRVELDGQEVLVGEGTKMLRLLAGRHQLVASRPGFVTKSEALELTAGGTLTQEIELAKEEIQVVEKSVNYERRWRWWVPWAVAAGSVAVALGGTVVYLDARSDIKAYDQKYAAACPAGCTDEQIPLALRNDDDLARRKSGYGIAMWSTAAVVGVVAGALAVMNRPRPVEERRPTLSMVVTPAYVGGSLTLSWW
jgi:tetratricopeptide (TPR) repeat protein